jgi:transposase-like protein
MAKIKECKHENWEIETNNETGDIRYICKKCQKIVIDTLSDPLGLSTPLEKELLEKELKE